MPVILQIKSCARVKIGSWPLELFSSDILILVQLVYFTFNQNFFFSDDNLFMVDFSRCHENWFEIEIQIWIEEVMFNSWIVLFLNYPRRFEFLRFLSFLAFEHATTDGL